MTNDKKTKLDPKLFILTYENWRNRQNFISGGICVPQFESYEDMIEFYEAINSSFPSTDKKFIEEVKHENIQFDIPERYKKISKESE